MQSFTRFGLLAVLLTLIETAKAAQVTVTQASCLRMYFTLTLTPQEIRNAAYLGVYSGSNTAGTMISEVEFDNSFANANSYAFYAPYFPGVQLNPGTQDITFQLLDTTETPIAAYPAITQSLNFQCSTTAASTSAANPTPSSSTSGSSGSNSSGGSNTSSNNGTNQNLSSSSSSSTGAIAGGVVGGIAALAAVGILAFCLMRKKKRQRNQQKRLRNDEADEAAFRAPNNNDSTASLATAPENANTPMMREVSPKNVFADPSISGVSGAPSITSTQYTGAQNKVGSDVAAGAAAAAGGIGAAAIAARKQSREQTRARSPSHSSERSPSSEFSKDMATPSSQAPPPVPALPSAAAAPTNLAAKNTSSTRTPASYPSPSAKDSSVAPVAAGATAAAVAAGAAAKAGSNDAANKDNKAKTSKWGFKRASKDTDSTKPPYPSAVPEVSAASSAPVEKPSSSSTTASSKSPDMPASPSRSFKVMQKPVVASTSTAGPSSASIAPSENSLNRAAPAFAPRSGPATPAGSVRGRDWSRAPSVASMSAGFADAPPMPSGAASVASAPAGEFGSNMAGVGAGRSFAASSGNSTKWHQQAYNIMPNFSHRALARSTQLDEDLIFGHLGMGLNPPPGPAGNGSETGSSKSRTDPFGDR